MNHQTVSGPPHASVVPSVRPPSVRPSARKMSKSEALCGFEFTSRKLDSAGEGLEPSWVLQLLMNGRGDRNLLKPTLDSHLFKSRLHHWAPREIMVCIK